MTTELPYQITKTYEELVEEILLQIVHHHEDLDVRDVKDASFPGKSIKLEIRCHKDDRGKVIGKKGACISAITTLITAMTEGSYRIGVEVIED